MDNSSFILIDANDCSVFNNQEGHSEVIMFFIQNFAKWDFFHFSSSYERDDDSQIAYFNYSDSKWYAGRFVGEAIFEHKGKNYKIKINPRFGDLFLFRMLEEIFKIRFTDSKSLLAKHDSLQYLIKKVISFLWLNLLAKANVHGLPKHNINITHKGTVIKGKVNIRKSIVPLYTEKKLISNYSEKALNVTVAKILSQSYLILLQNFRIVECNYPANAKDAIEQLYMQEFIKSHVTEREYHKIIYKDIYKSYKPLVDLSWDIIRRKNIGVENPNKPKDSFSFFIDMAEIWEMYLKSLLKRVLTKHGWSLKNEKLTAYKGKKFYRTLIPDIVFEKNNDVLVFDAKYKLMRFIPKDYDRTDFFQIHTYINYLHHFKNVLLGGLLFPLSSNFDMSEIEKNRADKLFMSDKSNTKYIVDGIDLSSIANEGSTANILFKERESDFADRIKALLNVNSGIN